jgi:thioredoxin reductase
MELVELKQIDTDVAIVGGGCGGMAAAVTVAERGVRAAVFEKAPHLAAGGNGTFAEELCAQTGIDTDGLGKPYMSAFAYNTGRMAGENAAEYVKSVSK